jgi:nucleotidyltransferase substrate binding protein (TIGR01987 family)
MNQDTRWKQRFSNYRKALATLKEGIDLHKERPLSKLEKQGVIQGFEFTHELSWKVMQDFLKEKGSTGIYGSKDATRMAFNRGIIGSGEDWMKMVTDRNKSSHTYQEEISDEIFERIINTYYDLFKDFEKRMEALWHSD